MEFQLQSAVEGDSRPGFLRFTRRLAHPPPPYMTANPLPFMADSRIAVIA